eukprot:m.14923 g.14923  ORF g.14923 m.14923 type:complete len:393 (+) comp4929_c0_seq1:55-1233(+)
MALFQGDVMMGGGMDCTPDFAMPQQQTQQPLFAQQADECLMLTLPNYGDVTPELTSGLVTRFSRSHVYEANDPAAWKVIFSGHKKGSNPRIKLENGRLWTLHTPEGLSLFDNGLGPAIFAVPLGGNECCQLQKYKRQPLTDKIVFSLTDGADKCYLRPALSYSEFRFVIGLTDGRTVRWQVTREHISIDRAMSTTKKKREEMQQQQQQQQQMLKQIKVQQQHVTLGGLQHFTLPDSAAEQKLSMSGIMSLGEHAKQPVQVKVEQWADAPDFGTLLPTPNSPPSSLEKFADVDFFGQLPAYTATPQPVQLMMQQHQQQQQQQQMQAHQQKLLQLQQQQDQQPTGFSYGAPMTPVQASQGFPPMADDFLYGALDADLSGYLPDQMDLTLDYTGM